MPQTIEKVIKPERVVLQDGRKGYFFNIPNPNGAVLVVKYPPTPSRKRRIGKTVVAKKAGHSKLTSSVIKALKEVKSRKAASNYPSKDFDALMDEL